MKPWLRQQWADDLRAVWGYEAPERPGFLHRASAVTIGGVLGGLLGIFLSLFVLEWLF